jgi:hypothetical protein
MSPDGVVEARILQAAARGLSSGIIQPGSRRTAERATSNEITCQRALQLNLERFGRHGVFQSGISRTAA